MKENTMKIVLGMLLALPAFGQQIIAWKATTGDVSLMAAGTKATIQKTTNNSVTVYIDKIEVYCSVACSVTQTANGTAASATAGTINPVLPTLPTLTMPFNFYTASNVGSGTDQGGITHVPAGGTVVFCLSPNCSNGQQVYLGTTDGGVGTNYTIVIGSITGTVNITFYGRVTS